MFDTPETESADQTESAFKRKYGCFFNLFIADFCFHKLLMSSYRQDEVSASYLQ